ncbi:MAG: DNA polymerase III, subunit gamma and tau [Candidatus Magasanikbacteria bacterium RIFCSPLOWO2_12_FULL_47_9b]|nr:MAG: DNA polymerase III, subunit gamma and tau [Candidatus Magasanikbacteria bacterium RIFCSPLOWO2_02_FULL_47_16]OGH80040.1 MAG: DNA polymerase III, subunit gamma and tau [Candidatus Magasanikbacteria bacterium RIFCSPHIGHO2_02_FULL_48_18]OGH81852.1 MAG: DNA polymerase III, subunit gamma and tau [Candidatus Magasanikbacteria bacterium RIFCSPLOWO2_12_FULL_47_9b]
MSGQDHIVQTLTSQIGRKQTAHAYLFSGPRGVGKTTAARLLAKALNCENRPGGASEPCNTCASCKDIRHGRSIDVVEIDAASHTGVDMVRQNIIETAQFKPARDAYKIFIIDEVHMLSTSAFNALLKIMEEPPTHVVFVLATTEAYKIPETVLSRCQRFHFSKIPYVDMEKTLKNILKKENRTIDKDVLNTIIQKSEGCLRDALSLLDQLLSTGDQALTKENTSLFLPAFHDETIQSLICSFVTCDRKAGLDAIATLSGEDMDMVDASDSLLAHFRYMLMALIDPKLKQADIHLDDHTKMVLQSLAEQITQKELVQLMDLIIRRKKEIRSSPTPQLQLELALVEWCEHHSAILPSTVLPQNETAPLPHPTKMTQNISSDDTPHSRTEKKILSRDVVEGEWGAILDTMEKMSPSLVFILKMAHLKEIDGNTIVCTVEYSFHKDKLMETSSKKMIEHFFSEALHVPVLINIQLAEQKQPEENNTLPQELQGLVSALGGEIL